AVPLLTTGWRRTLRTRRGTIGSTRTTRATVARRALRGHTVRVGQQRHLASVLDRTRDLTLLLRVVTGHASSADLRSVGHEPAQQVDVLVVDVVDALLDEDARLLLRTPSVVF